VNTDKNHNILEKQLKTLGQKVRIDILKKLKNVQTPLSFSGIQKEVLRDDHSSVNLSFHLNTLKKCELVDSSEEGYSITILGAQIIEKILSIEQILDQQNQTRMIRTSKYSKELFDASKIEEYLVIEGELEQYLAQKIAHEVEERLSKTNIEYLTAPLMREYINAILLENGLEEVRHKLTRLGTPPFEVFKIFDSKNSQIYPETFIEKLGSDVSEQFLLLNLIPKSLADFYLSGEIALLHLNYWALRPLGMYINTKTLMDYLFKQRNNLNNKLNEKKAYLELIIHFSEVLHNLKHFYSGDLVLGNFNSQFLSRFSLPKAVSSEFPLLASQVVRLNNNNNEQTKSSLSLEFSYSDCPADQQLFDEAFFKSIIMRCKNHITPFFIFEYSQNDNILNLIINYLKSNVILYNKSNPNLFNSSIIQIANPKKNQVILDKILINLHSISVQAKYNDEKFLELLQEKINAVFELFNYKEKLVKKKLNSLKQWNLIASNLFNSDKKDILKNALKSISFFGLNEAIFHHCGIELDRTESSKSFALRILNSMKTLIKEKNDTNSSNFVLSQPHYDSYLDKSWYNGRTQYNRKIRRYSSMLIREESNLSLNKKIMLFKKFQDIFDRGSLFVIETDGKESKLSNYLKTIINSKISAILLKDYIQ
jgi:DNA-binding HxlR family transcriptional regulator